jgi:hypothetical protein
LVAFDQRGNEVFRDDRKNRLHAVGVEELTICMAW